MRPAHWLFARHGQSVANRDGRLAGRLDSPLTVVGRSQALALAREVARLGPATVVCSPLARARDTARLAAPGSPRVVYPLVERHLGAWEGARRGDLQRAGHMATLLSWRQAPPGGESQEQVARRALGWLASARLEGPILAVCHGGVLRAVLGLLDGVPQEEIGRLRFSHATLHAREVEASTWGELLRALPEVP